jgi:hypothetical protein
MQNQDNVLKSLSHSWLYLAGIGILAMLFFHALELRLPGITKNFWQDEMQHNFSVIHPTHLKWMLQLISSQQQPFLDYFLRKYFWVMMFGHNEITLRIPSIIYSLGTVSLCFTVPFYFLKNRNLPTFYVLAASVITALFALNNPTEIRYSVEARHYSFASFASVIWISIFLFYNGKHKNLLFALASFLLFNIHFFSIPLILGGYTYIIADSLFRKAYKECVISFLFFVGVFAISIGINYQAFLHMMSRPPGAVDANYSIAESIDLGLNKYRTFMTRYMFLYFSPLVLFLINLVFIRRPENQKLILLTFIIMPLFLIYVSTRSDYGFVLRYYTPFFGIGLGLLTLALYNVYNMIEHVQHFIKDRKKLSIIRNSIATIFIGFILVSFNVQSFLASLAGDHDRIKLPPKNFSEYYQIYQEIKEPRVPLFIINSQGWGDFTVYLYMRWMGKAGHNRGYDYGFELVNSRGAGLHPVTIKDAQERLNRFIRTNPNGKIILDNKQSKILKDASIVENDLVATKVQRVRCCDRNVWILSNITSADQVYQIANVLEVPGKMFIKSN